MIIKGKRSTMISGYHSWGAPPPIVERRGKGRLIGLRDTRSNHWNTYWGRAPQNYEFISLQPCFFCRYLRKPCLRSLDHHHPNAVEARPSRHASWRLCWVDKLCRYSGPSKFQVWGAFTDVNLNHLLLLVLQREPTWETELLFGSPSLGRSTCPGCPTDIFASPTEAILSLFTTSTKHWRASSSPYKVHNSISPNPTFLDSKVWVPVRDMLAPRTAYMQTQSTPFPNSI